MQPCPGDQKVTVFCSDITIIRRKRSLDGVEPRGQICEAVRSGGDIVWANTPLQEGLLGRSDLPLRTAVGAPICSFGRDLCVLVLFSPFQVQVTKTA